MHIKLIFWLIFLFFVQVGDEGIKINPCMSRRKPSEGRLTIFRYTYTRRGKNTLKTASTRSKYIFQFSSKFFRNGIDMCFMVCYNINIP